jgi:hypothetical protein
LGFCGWEQSPASSLLGLISRSERSCVRFLVNGPTYKCLAALSARVGALAGAQEKSARQGRGVPSHGDGPTREVGRACGYRKKRDAASTHIGKDEAGPPPVGSKRRPHGNAGTTAEFLAEEARPRFDSLRAQTRPCQAAGQCPTHRRGPHDNRSAPGTFQSDCGGHRRHVGSSEFYFRSEDEGGH